MKAYISHTGWFEKFTGISGETGLEIEKGASAIDAAESIGIPESEIGFITVNNVKKDKEYILNEDDHIRVYPLIIGG